MGALLLQSRKGSALPYDDAHQSLRFSYSTQILAEFNSAQTFYRFPTPYPPASLSGFCLAPVGTPTIPDSDWPLRHTTDFIHAIPLPKSKKSAHKIHMPLLKSKFSRHALLDFFKEIGESFRNSLHYEPDGSTIFPPLLPARALCCATPPATRFYAAAPVNLPYIPACASWIATGAA